MMPDTVIKKDTEPLVCMKFQCGGVVEKNVLPLSPGGYRYSRPTCNKCGRVHTEGAYRDAPVSVESLKKFREQQNT